MYIKKDDSCHSSPHLPAFSNAPILGLAQARPALTSGAAAAPDHREPPHVGPSPTPGPSETGPKVRPHHVPPPWSRAHHRGLFPESGRALP